MGAYGMGGGGPLEGELAAQAHMDTLMQQFLYQKSAQEYGEALPLESYYKDMLGDILGVDFANPDFGNTFGSYLQGGMQGGDPFGGYYQGVYDPNLHLPVDTGGVPADDPNSPQQPDNRVRLPDDDPALRVASLSAGAPGSVSASYVGDRDPSIPSDRDKNGNPIQTPPVDSSPMNDTQKRQLDETMRRLKIGPYTPGMGGASYGGSGPIPVAPFPTLEGKGYSIKSGPAMDIANRNTWGLLAPEVNREVGDMDSLLKRYEAQMPVGGERAMGESQILQNTGGAIQGIRQNMLSGALQGVAGLSGAKKGYNPAGYSGSGQALLGDATTRRGQDLSNSQFEQQLAQQGSQFSQTLAAQRSAANKSLFGGLLSTVGSLLPTLLKSDARTKENIEPHMPGLTELAALPTYGWDYKPEHGGEHGFGVLAQDLEKVIPEAVVEVAGLKFVQPMAILATTMNAIKELKDRMDAELDRSKRSRAKRRAA